MDQHEEIWLVQLQNGSVRAMTLDELDAAYQEGAIDEDTYVRHDGASKWSRLRDEIGGAEPTPAPSPTPAPVSYGAVPTYPVVQQQALYSTRPVVSELDMDELELGSPFKKSRKGTYAAVGVVAVAAIATAIFGASKLGGAPAESVNASVAAAAQPPQVVAPPVTQPAAATLSDDKRKELDAMDKKNQSKWEQQHQNRVRNAAPVSHWHKSAQPFHKGGNKYDPLNSKL